MTSLYARTGNRWYVKEVRSGKGKELELSKEEQSAIKRAQIDTENMNKQQYITTAIIGLALYLISTGLSFAVFTNLVV